MLFHIFIQKFNILIISILKLFLDLKKVKKERKKERMKEFDNIF